jgi:hypothetical protein
MKAERNQLLSEVDKLENEFLSEFSKLSIDELNETNAGKELLELLQDSEILPSKTPYEAPSSSLKSLVWNSMQTLQPIARKQNIDFHLDLIDPPFITKNKNYWQEIFNQLVGSTIKYSFQGRFNRPNIIRIYGRQGVNAYIIILENYGEQLNNEMLTRQYFSRLKDEFEFPLYKNKHLALKSFIEQQGGRLLLNSKNVDEIDNDLFSKSKNALNQITLYIPIEPKTNDTD